MEDRRQFCFRAFTFLRDNPLKCFNLDPRSFSGRHVDLLMAEWRRRAEAGELGAAALQKYHSFLTTFAGWIGKPKLVKPLSAYFADPALITRSYIAVEPKAWRARGVDVEQLLAQIDGYDVHAATSLRLMQAFGLRFKEACMLRSHADVLTPRRPGSRRAVRRCTSSRAVAPRVGASAMCRSTPTHACAPSRQRAAWPTVRPIA